MPGTVRKKRKPPVAHKYVPTPEDRRKVEQLKAFGLTTEQVGIVLGVSKGTVEKHFRIELSRGDIKANAMVAQNLFRTATEGRGMVALTAQIFWLKTRARWREVDRLEVTGADGQPLKLGVVAIPPKAKSIEEWVKNREERRALAERTVIDADSE